MRMNSYYGYFRSGVLSHYVTKKPLHKNNGSWAF